MRHSVRDHLRLIITIALALVKRKHRRDYSERITSRSDPAIQAIALRISEAVMRHFDVEIKPDRSIGPPLGSSDTVNAPDDRLEDCRDSDADRQLSKKSR